MECTEEERIERYDQLIFEYSKELLKISHQQTATLGHYLMTLSSVAIGLSLGQLAQIEAAMHTELVIISWILFLISIFANLYAQMTNNHMTREYSKELMHEYVDKTKGLPELLLKKDASHLKIANWFTAGGFFSGVVLLVVFAISQSW